MTREMNKPEYHATWYFRMLDSIDSINCTFEMPKERKLDEDWLVFVKELNKNLGVND